MVQGLPVAPISPNDVHPAIAALLLAATEAEGNATGSYRRKQFRITRRLLSAARTNGVPLEHIANILRRSVDSVRARSHEDGVISAEDFSSLVNVPVAQINEWEYSGQLPSTVTERDGYVGYPSHDLLKVFLALRR